MFKKSSEQWSKKCKVIILDPDGWDRKNYDFSWHKEKISKKEFEMRLASSTCDFRNCKSILDIWK